MPCGLRPGCGSANEQGLTWRSCPRPRHSRHQVRGPRLAAALAAFREDATPHGPQSCRFGAAPSPALLVLGGPARVSLGQPHQAPCAVADRRAASTGPISSTSTGSIPNAPKGGRVRHGPMGTFDRSTRSRSRADGRRPRPDLRHADGHSPDEPSTEYGLIAEWVVLSRRTSPRPPSSCARGALPRRQADHAGGRHLLARGHQEGLPATTPSTTRTSSRPRRPATTRSPSPSTSRATASCR